MTFALGLTGSIGMGKSTTAQMFADEGVPVWDADAAVHRLYAKGGAAVAAVGETFPSAVLDGALSRDVLAAIIASDPAALARLESIVHPLVAQDRLAFLDAVTSEIAVLDIPLLYETGADRWLDAVACVTAPATVQRDRVLARSGMTPEKFELILRHQLPDAEKRARADYVIETKSPGDARAGVREIIADIRQMRR